MKPFILAALTLALGAPQAIAQGSQPAAPPPAPAPAPAPPQTPDDWMVSDSQVASVAARVAFPRRIGTLNASRTQEASNEGQHIDNAIQYTSSDNQVFATVYIYYPGLPHAGLAAFMTDYTIRTSQPATRVTTPARLVAAGGMPDVAIRIDYANYRGTLASSAAFIKTGRWIIKLRVSGPEARRAEVETAMAALLEQVRFGVQNPVMAPHPINVTPCPDGAGRTAATALPDPAGAEIAAHGMLLTFDGGGNPATVEGSAARRDLPPRVPDQLCLTRLNVGNGQMPLLRGEAGDAISVDGRTMLVVMMADNGDALEIVHARNLNNRYLMLYHQVGQTSLLGEFDGVPSDAQVAAILSGANREGGRIRVPVQFRPNRGPQMFLPSIAPPATQSGATPARPPSQ